MESKNILTSWTFWFNAIAAIVMVLQLPEIQALNIIPQSWMAIVAVIGNVLLRIKTKQPVTVLPPQVTTRGGQPPP